MSSYRDADLKIVQIDVWPVDVRITDDFVISRGRVSTAENLFVQLRLACGAVGYGEIAPFKDLTGEDRATSHQVARRLASRLIGHPAGTFRRLGETMAEDEPGQPAARCGLETALLDALCRALGLPLYGLWGGARLSGHETDMTIPILDAQRCVELAEHWHAQGFRVFKLKVGSDAARDFDVVRQIHARFPDAAFILDANQGFDEAAAIEYIAEVARLRCNVLLYEQPVAREDLQGMAAVRASTSIPVVADESVANAREAIRVVEARAADGINLKITKSGVLEALKIATVAHSAGLKLMIGGMVETRLGMGCSLALAAGLGWIESLDLDTPLLLAEDPIEGGYRYDGPQLALWTEPGLGLRPRVLPEAAP
jgi:L-Ala-D/L-Glu epimerase